MSVCYWISYKRVSVREKKPAEHTNKKHKTWSTIFSYSKTGLPTIYFTAVYFTLTYIFAVYLPAVYLNKLLSVMGIDYWTALRNTKHGSLP